MAKSPKQKLKLIYLMQLFLEKTDDTHYITMTDILRELESKDINAERKAIYDDLQVLREYGMEIEGFQQAVHSLGNWTWQWCKDCFAAKCC